MRLLGLRGLSVVSTRVLGTGVPGHVSGAINSASFYEPLALVYADKILYVGCYGGEHHGTVSAVTPTAFAVRTLGALSKAYNAHRLRAVECNGGAAGAPPPTGARGGA